MAISVYDACLYDGVPCMQVLIAARYLSTGFYLHQSVRYPYYWCEDAITTVLALSIFLMGVHGLYQDATAGHKWWTADFWCAPIPQEDEKEEHSKHDSKTDYGSNNEATPLVKP
jgi:hypothetical protein